MRAEREQAVARRRDALTGTSDFPDLAEAPVTVLDVPPVAAPPYPAALRFDALPSVRLAEPFETLRDASDRILAQSGARPKVFLANLGKLADFTARATFAKNFFEAGGIEAVTNDGFAGRDQMIAAFKARAPSSPACARPTTSMPARPKTLPRRWRRPARLSISPAGRANASRRCGPPVLRASSLPAATCSPRSRTAHAPHCQLTAKPSDCRRPLRSQDTVTNDEQSRTPIRLAQAHRPPEPDRDRDRRLRLL